LQTAGWIELDGSGKASYYRLTDGARQAQARASRAAAERCGSPAPTKAVR
jgi:DNA-binding transcriptional regulator PaaX